MLTTDLLVGAVSIGLGGFVLAAGVFNWEWYYQLRKLNCIAARWGRGKARIFNVMLGLFLIVLGIAIAAGFGPNKTTSQRIPAGTSVSS